MNRGTRAVLATLLSLASQAGGGGCEPVGAPGYSCHVSAEPLRVADDGHVTTVVRNWCEPGYSPLRQTFFTWIETRRGPADPWLVAGPTGVERIPPDVEGVVHRLRDGRCQPDVEYGVAWRAQGVDRNGVEFDTKTVRERTGRTDLC